MSVLRKSTNNQLDAIRNNRGISRRDALITSAAAFCTFLIDTDILEAAQTSKPVFGAYTGYAGRYPDGTRSYLHTQAMLGQQPLGMITAFGDSQAWFGWGDGTGHINGSMESSAQYDLSQLAGCGMTLLWSQPIAMGYGAFNVFGYGGDTNHPKSGLQDVASGAFDATFSYIAKQLIANGFANAVIRLGWEFNIPAFPWGNPWDNQNAHAASYVAAYRHAAQVMRAVPGNKFRLMWCPNKGKPSSPTTNIALAYPGDDVVDMIGMDVYDDDLDWNNPQGFGTNVSKTSAQRWQESCLGAIEDQRLAWLAVFSTTPSMRPALNGGHSIGTKPMIIGEWGAGGPTSFQNPPNDTYARAVAYAGGDDGYYVGQMLSWMRSNSVYGHGLYDIFDTSVGYTGAISFDTTLTKVSGAGYQSNTNNSISTGLKSFSVLAGLPLREGYPVLIVDPGNPKQRFLEATISSYVGTNLSINCFACSGSGSLSRSVITTHPNALAPKSLAAVQSYMVSSLSRRLG